MLRSLRAAALGGARVRLLSTPAAENGQLARYQRFREHVYQLHRSDPERWTGEAIAHRLGLPAAATHAVLALQEGEARAAPDPELVALAQEVEDCLLPDLDEDAEQVADLISASHLVDGRGGMDAALRAMDARQEGELVRALAKRLGVDASAPDAAGRFDDALSALLASVSPSELEELSAAVRDGPPSAEASAAGASADATRAELLRLIAPTLPPAIHAAQSRPRGSGEAADSDAGGLDLAQLDLPAVGELGGWSAGGEGSSDGSGATDSGVTDAGVTASNDGKPTFLVLPDAGPDVGAYLSRSALKRLHQAPTSPPHPSSSPPAASSDPPTTTTARRRRCRASPTRTTRSSTTSNRARRTARAPPRRVAGAWPRAATLSSLTFRRRARRANRGMCGYPRRIRRRGRRERTARASRRRERGARRCSAWTRRSSCRAYGATGDRDVARSETSVRCSRPWRWVRRCRPAGYTAVATQRYVYIGSVYISAF